MNSLKIILDTNFFFVPFDFKVDIFQEFDRIIQRTYEIVTFPAIIEELKNLGKKDNSIKMKKKIQNALKFVEKCKICEEDFPLPAENIDDFITRIAKREKWVVATNDGNLKKKLKNNGIPIIFLRQKSHLMVEGLIF